VGKASIISQPTRPAQPAIPPWDSKMSSGDLGTADWGCLASRCASLRLQAAHDGRATDGSG